MKKNTARILSIISVPFLGLVLATITGCSGSNICPLVYGDKNATTVKDITYAELASKVNDKENFLLAVQPSNACICWNNFLPIVNKYIESNHLIVYHIRINEMSTENYFGLSLKEGYTTFAIFKNGNVMVQEQSGNGSVIEDEKLFVPFMEKYTTNPTMFYVTLDDVNSLYSANKKSVIMFARSNCGDCTYAEKNILKSYSIAHRNSNPMYILDCETIGVRVYDKDGNLTPESQTAWNEFKETYGLASKFNPIYGYDTGYVPTFFLVGEREGAVNFYSGCVFFNDTVTKDNDIYKISNSYYTNERLPYLQYLKDSSDKKVLKDLELNSEAVNEIEYKGQTYYSFKQEAAAYYHNPILTSFLDYALPQVEK